MATLIGNRRIVTAEGVYLGDVLLEDGKVRMLGRDLPSPAGAEIDDAGSAGHAGRGRRPQPPRLGVDSARSVDTASSVTKAWASSSSAARAGGCNLGLND